MTALKVPKTLWHMGGIALLLLLIDALMVSVEACNNNPEVIADYSKPLHLEYPVPTRGTFIFVLFITCLVQLLLIPHHLSGTPAINIFISAH